MTCSDPLIAALTRAIDFDQISLEQRKAILSKFAVNSMVKNPSHFGLEYFPKFFGIRLKKWMRNKVSEETKICLLKNGFVGMNYYVDIEDTQKLIDDNDEDFEENVLPHADAVHDEQLQMMEKPDPLIIALADAINFEIISQEQKNEIYSKIPHVKFVINNDPEGDIVYNVGEETEQASIIQLKIMALKYGLRYAAQVFGELTNDDSYVEKFKIIKPE